MLNKEEIDRQMVEGYRRMPQGGEHDVDEWGDLGRAVAALSAETFRALGEGWKALLVEQLTTPDDARMREVCHALDVAVGC